jgi:hypothetical protein
MLLLHGATNGTKVLIINDGLSLYADPIMNEYLKSIILQKQRLLLYLKRDDQNCRWVRKNHARQLENAAVSVVVKHVPLKYKNHPADGIRRSVINEGGLQVETTWYETYSKSCRLPAMFSHGDAREEGCLAIVLEVG